MGRTRTLESIVLKTHDVGEADRFCILFTKELGKIAARARSVRKPGSRIGGTVLPTSHCSLQVVEGSAGFLITDAKRISEHYDQPLGSFLNVQQGMELLLSVLHDEEPMPELFDATLAFFDLCANSKTHTVAPFTLKLLSLLGLLPDIDAEYFAKCSDNQKDFLRKSIGQQWGDLPELTKEERLQFSEQCAELLSEICSRNLQAGAIGKKLME